MKEYKEETKEKEDMNSIEKIENLQKEDLKESDKTEEEKVEDLKKEQNNDVEKKSKIEDSNETKSLDNNITEKAKKNKSKIMKNWIFIFIILFFILLFLSTCFAILNMKNLKIISGITVEGVNIQGLTKEEAIKKVKEEMIIKDAKPIYLKTEGLDYSVEANQIEPSYNIEETIKNAYNYGRNSNIFTNNYQIIFAKIFGKKINLNMVHNEELLNKIIEDIEDKIPNVLVDSNYYIENDKLVITKGTSGNTINKDKTKEMILKKIKKNDGQAIIIEILYTDPKKIDIEQIYNEVHTEPKDAYYTKDPFEIFTHVNGIDFDITLAKEILKEEKNEYIIDLIITYPKILINDIGTEAFPDLLGTFSTKYNSENINRTRNLELAASKINNTVVAAGETFSYNKTVGERTINAGYKSAAGYSGGEVVDMLGGGICQISSTLYDAVVYANLDIVSRTNHAFLTSYTTAGRDATVVYGAIDFKFKNTRKYPILIKMSVHNGVAKAEIYGIKEDIEYEIEINTTILNYLAYTTVYKEDSSLTPGTEKNTQGGMNGCRSITYKIKKLNGVEVSREILSSDTYSAMNRIIKRGPTIEKKEIIIEDIPGTEEENNVIENPLPETDPETDPEIEPEENQIINEVI